MQNLNSAAARLRSGYHISPDISIHLVRPDGSELSYSEHRSRLESTDSESSVGPANGDEYEDGYLGDCEYARDCTESDEEHEPYFNALSLCTISMEVDEPVNAASQQTRGVKRQATATASRKPKKSARNTTESNENSSFVCNGGETGASRRPKKRFPCPICHKTFGWTTDLKRHILIHTGERPFKCPLCVSTFTRNFLLQKHKTKMHPCGSASEASQLNNNVAKNVMEIKRKMQELEVTKRSTNDT